MGRAGTGIWDSDQVWDLASDLSDLAKVDLALAGVTDIEPIGDLPIKSVDDTRKHMNRNGLFNIIFDALKQKDSNTYALIIFTALNMKVGTKIRKRDIKYLKEVYADIEIFDHLPESREQVRCALEEYVSGVPYTFKDFDFGESDHEEPVEAAKPVAEVKTVKSPEEPAAAASKKRSRAEDEGDKENEVPEADAETGEAVPAKKAKIGDDKEWYGEATIG